MAAQIPTTVEAGTNITGRGQQVTAVHKPKSVDDVLMLVQQARSHKTPLYPVSRGYNWGYGSASPAAILHQRTLVCGRPSPAVHGP